MSETVSAQDDAILRSMHPDCTDWQTLGPTTRDAAIRAVAAGAEREKHQRKAAWSKGFNRRTFLKAGMGVGVAALGSQLVTSRVSYASAATPSNGTLVVIFLRGGLDGLSLLVPDNDPYLLKKRPGILARSSATNQLIPMGRGFGLHPSMKPLKPLIDRGQLAVVPAVSTPDLTRSHFQAQDCLERGSSNSLTTGWLDRVLEAAGPGTTFRSVAVGGTLPRSLMGESRSLAMRDLDSLKINVDAREVGVTRDALERLYTGLDHPIAAQAELVLSALDTAKAIRDARPAAPAVVYPENSNFADALASLAELIKAGAGVRVACIDVGGWDTHTGMGTVDGGDMKRQLDDLAACLRAFTDDLGADHLGNTTVVTMSEFGRRVEQNASGGTDHGHGGAVLVLGGGVSGGVKGRWDGLDDAKLANDEGDIPGWNDYRDVLTEVVTTRLDISQGAMSSVFPSWSPSAIGVMA
ncbi:DUF1501 domain-containing protein [Homoserinibacter sp. YIM 151385]|uniref:DUF1501 domain-containing protein n=1 Tax=Homoserinibacter sp. YIM 151385 TaxID=2985506 RepID=UPI0022F0DEDE|nr:DUF1501 domain-containing protein [Homoserinibacter sp. YIM 151385]WBU38840.1 DUF1501 domain-containing protein [Homoserinibacter sp. YIM 151385]